MLSEHSHDLACALFAFVKLIVITKANMAACEKSVDGVT